MVSKKVVHQFIKIDLLTLGFGIIFFFTEKILGENIQLTQVIMTSIIFWILLFLLEGFLGKFKTKENKNEH